MNLQSRIAKAQCDEYLNVDLNLKYKTEIMRNDSVQLLEILGSLIISDYYVIIP